MPATYSSALFVWTILARPDNAISLSLLYVNSQPEYFSMIAPQTLISSGRWSKRKPRSRHAGNCSGKVSHANLSWHSQKTSFWAKCRFRQERTRSWRAQPRLTSGESKRDLWNDPGTQSNKRGSFPWPAWILFQPHLGFRALGSYAWSRDEYN
jgi:hypothetical protein